MSNETRVIYAKHAAGHGTFISNVMGFILALFLTVTAYLIAAHHLFSHRYMIISIVALALLQFMVQLLFFLHLGKDSKPRWNVLVLLFMIIVVSILVFGSLWIMNNLNYHMMSPPDLKTYLRVNEGL